MEGRFPLGDAADGQTVVYRQSSVVREGGGAPARPPPPPFTQRRPDATAVFTPSHFAGGCGAFQRSGPTGGAANGMPLNTRTAASLPGAPDTMPESSFTGSVIAADAAVATNSTAAVMIRRFIALLYF